MFTLFLNPFTMLAGAGLIASPIVIHLINRMRYRRVRWAAMEFLLKAEKRNRRKTIIEQLILLLLRILLVLLLGLLLGRFVSDSLAFARPQGTLHVVLLDDTASMGDAWSEDGQPRNTFERAKQAVIDEIAAGAVQSATPQSLTLLRLSALVEPYTVERLNETAVGELANHLKNLQPTPLHLHPRAAFEKAKEIADATSDRKVAVHLVSDFRAADYAGADAEAVAQLATSLGRGRGANAVAVHLMDVAHPTRSFSQKAAPDHGNAGILDLQPETRVAAKFMPVDCLLTVANYGAAERKNVRVTVKVNGDERADSSTTIVSLPPGVTSKAFTVTFDRVGWNQVTANLEPEEAGLAIDNVRYAAVEVRERVPLLFVEGDWANRAKPEGDSFYLRALFLDAARGYEVVQKTVTDLETLPLEPYPAVYLLNVPRLTGKAQARLETYAKSGGGVAFFLGDKVNVDAYNLLHAGGRGLFPVPLDRPTDPPTDAQKLERMLDPTMPLKLFPRTESHPILSRVYRDDKNRDTNTYLRFLSLDRHFPVPRARWTPEPGRASELLTLPNGRSLDDFKEATQRLLNRLSVDDGKFGAGLKTHQRRIKDVLGTNRSPASLSDAIDAMLLDAGDSKDPTKPNPQEFWQAPDQGELRAAFRKLAESARYGDPLLVAQRYGLGQTVAYLSTAGSAWNDFPNGPARPYYVILMLELQKFLAGAGSDLNLKVGLPWEITADATRVEERLHRYYLPETPLPGADANAPRITAVDLREQPAAAQPGRWNWLFNEAIKPGVYRFDLKPRPAAGESAAVEQVAYAFNVDTAAEGDLRRAAGDELEAAVPGAKLHAPGSGLADTLKERRADLSETPWLFLGLLLLLLAEQAMSVRLSYHLGPTNH